MQSAGQDSARTWRRWIHVLGAIVLVAVVALFVVSSVPALVGADESYVVLSDSMSPSIKAGAIVFVNEVPTDQIERGDVITYRSDSSEPVTHRVVEVTSEGDQTSFRTKGDANEDADPTPVSPDSVIGTVGHHVPLIGYVVSFAGTDLGILALVIIPASLLIVLEIRDFWRDATEDSSDWEGKL